MTTVKAPYRVPVFESLSHMLGGGLLVIYLAEDRARRKWEFHGGEVGFEYDTLRPVCSKKSGSAYLASASAALKEYGPEVVIAGGWNQPAHMLAYLRRSRYGFAWWVESTLRDIRSGGRIANGVKRRMAQGADSIVVPGLASKLYTQSLGVDPRRIAVAPNAVDNGRFATARRLRAERRASTTSDNLPAALFVGRLVAHKGVYALLDAWGLRMVKRSRLLIAGDGPERGRMEDSIKRRGLQSIEFLGNLQGDELVAAYAAADVFVFPSHHDPWGLVINEAMAAGLPVVVSEIPGGVDDLVRGRGTGVLVPDGDVKRMAAALDRLFADERLRQHMAMRAVEVVGEYSAEACSRGLMEGARTALEARRSNIGLRTRR